MHSPELLDHFRSPRNSGELPPPAISAVAENPACGDILRLWAEIEEGHFAAVSFKARGCAASIAAGSVLTELLTGRPVSAAAEIPAQEIEAALGGLSPESKHAAVLASDAATALLRSCRGY